MKKNTLLILLCASAALAALGAALSADAYYKTLAITAAAEELDYLRNMPYVLDKSPLPLPSYHENPAMASRPCMKGALAHSAYRDIDALKEARAEVSWAPFRKISIYSVIDARLRK